MNLAEISPCGQYRYQLRRLSTVRQPSGPPAVFLMLNPSTADALQDDPTIRRCRGFAERWGCNGLVVVNLYGLRSSDPRALDQHSNPVGPNNDSWILRSARESARVVCAWGVNAKPDRVRDVVEVLDALGIELVCLGATKHGHPRHPLYVRADQPLVPWSLPCNP